MRELNSKNYEFVKVKIRFEEEPIKMTASKGDALMDHLTNKDIGRHVIVNDLYGNRRLINVNDIQSISPEYLMEETDLTKLEVK